MSFRLPISLLFAIIVTISIVKTANGTVLGGGSNISLDDGRMMKVLNDAIYVYNKQEHQGLTDHMRAGKVRGARQQVVAGLKYVIDFDFLYTKCKREESYLPRSEFDKCEHDKSREAHKCQTTLVYQPWNRKSPITINELKCENQYWL